MSKIFQYIQTDQIDSISGGDLEFKKELIDIFLEQIPEFISNITTSCNNKDWETLAREAHTAKSSALTFGMDEAGSLLKKIQLHAENKEQDFLPNLVAKVLHLLDSAIPELHALKQSI